MKILKQYIEGVIGIPLSLLLPKGMKLFPLDNEDPDKAYLFGSEVAKKRLYLVQADINPFIESSPIGFYQTGAWGHGCNTNNLYICRHDQWSRVYLRLHRGGAYSEPKKCAKRIRDFLQKYFAFEEIMRYHAESLIAVDSSSGLYRVTLFNGTTYELKESLFHNPDFNRIFGEDADELPIL